MRLPIHIFIVFLFSTFTLGCKKEIPNGKELYVGEWFTDEFGVSLNIEANGNAYYYGGQDSEIFGFVRFEPYGFKIKNRSNPLGAIEFEVTQEPTPDSSGYFMIANNITFFKY